jgi:hypothetical protein
MIALAMWGTFSVGRAEDAAEMVGDLVYTFQDGSEYTFHDDGTWDCVGSGCPSLDAQPFEVILGKDKTVVIEPDGRWHEKQKGELVGTNDIKIYKANVTGKGTNLRIDMAEVKARKQARKRMAEKIVRGAPRRMISVRKVLFCLDRLQVPEKIREKRDPKLGWTITATITLDRAQILEIIDCAEQVVEKESTEEQSAGKPSEQSKAPASVEKSPQEQNAGKPSDQVKAPASTEKSLEQDSVTAP